MKKRVLMLIGLILAVCILSGCWADFAEYAQAVQESADAGYVIKYGDMEYTRPDLDAVQQALEAAREAAAGDDPERIIEQVYAFYDVYDAYYTNYSLADIRYCGDLTDIYWEDEYNFCVENSAQVDAALDSLYRALAKSPCREVLEGEEYFGAGYFDAYEEESGWDAEFLALLEQEADLQGQYYDLSSEALEYEYGSEEYFDAFTEDMAQILVELIRVRQEMASYWGYSDYVRFATDFYHYRDYTVDQTAAYLEDIQRELVGLYRTVNQSGIWETGFTYATEKQTYDYVREMAKNMGGTVEEAFNLMDAGDLYDISYGENKYNSSFEVYLTSYWEPFIFMNPEGSTYDFLTFAHEFGHFCNDYASYGSYAGTDVLEVFSQGMEYLSLSYVEGTEKLTQLKMADSLCIYVEQAAFADFEMAMYDLRGDDLTVENLIALYDETARAYGFDSVGYDAREFVTITHYYTNPMYIISYVVSNDAAMQLYQMEQASSGAGLACFEENLSTTEYYFLSFLDSAGLECPFAQGRIQRVRETFEEILQ